MIYPFSLVYVTSDNWDYRRSIVKDFQSPRCRDYTTRPVSQLAQPPYDEGGGCWHSYTSRASSRHEGTSYTLDDYDEAGRAWRVRQMGKGSLCWVVRCLSPLRLFIS